MRPGVRHPRRDVRCSARLPAPRAGCRERLIRASPCRLAPPQRGRVAIAAVCRSPIAEHRARILGAAPSTHATRSAHEHRAVLGQRRLPDGDRAHLAARSAPRRAARRSAARARRGMLQRAPGSGATSARARRRENAAARPGSPATSSTSRGENITDGSEPSASLSRAASTPSMLTRFVRLRALEADAMLAQPRRVRRSLCRRCEIPRRRTARGPGRARRAPTAAAAGSRWPRAGSSCPVHCRPIDGQPCSRARRASTPLEVPEVPESESMSAHARAAASRHPRASLAPRTRRALLEERPRPFGHVLGRREQRRSVGFEAEPLVERHLEPRSTASMHDASASGAFASIWPSIAFARGEQLGGRNDLVHQPDAYASARR